MKYPRLRDSGRLLTHEPYPINEFPEDLLVKIGAHIVYLIYTGRKDLSGSDWGDAFAEAVGGTHLDSPAGIADVVLDKMAWSLKTVKNANPFKAEKGKTDKREMLSRLFLRHHRPPQRHTKDRPRRARNMERKGKHSIRLLQSCAYFGADPLLRYAIILYVRRRKPPVPH